MARRNNQDVTRIKDPDELNERNIDRAYDQDRHVGTRLDVKLNFWTR